MVYASSPGSSAPPSQLSSTTNTQVNSPELLANSAPVPGTELRLNFGSSGVIDVEDSCNPKEASAGITILISTYFMPHSNSILLSASIGARPIVQYFVKFSVQ
jgi:hypothetical protein